MKTPLSRKDFLTKSLIITSGLVIAPQIFTGQQTEESKALPSHLVSQFVTAAHSDFEKIKGMLEENPMLLNASWDWGGGDFETALGAAGHMGLLDIANLLLSKGARADIFVFAMLGKTEIVKSLLRNYPELLHSKGPHGFTLLHHAEKGGKNSEKILTHLQSLGLKESHIKLQ